MSKKNKTKKEKIKSGYRLQNFRLNLEEAQGKKDVEEFTYLQKDFVKKDLTKTVVFSALIVILLLVAKKYLG